LNGGGYLKGKKLIIRNVNINVKIFANYKIKKRYWLKYSRSDIENREYVKRKITSINSVLNKIN